MEDTLLTVLQSGENYYIEFKSDIISNNELSKESIAFANAEGGTIYFGIQDDGSIIGLPYDASLEEKLMNVLRNNCYPSLRGDAQWIQYQNKHILQLDIQKGIYKPYSTKDGDFYIRVGSTKRKASKEELSRLLQSSGYYQYDHIPVGHGAADDLDKGMLSEYFHDIYKLELYNPREVNDVEALLVNAKILADTGEKICPTVAGLLAFGIKPQALLFQSGIIFARINGKKIYDDIMDTKHLEGRLPQLIDQCLSLFKLYNQRRSEFVNGKRIDTDAYLVKVFRELIVNAVCHRNYSISGSRIRVLMLNDRYEIRSPGRLPNTVTIDNIKTGACFLRNQLVFKFLNHFGYIENLGRGIPMSMRAALEYSGKPLELEEVGEEFVVRVYKRD